MAVVVTISLATSIPARAGRFICTSLLLPLQIDNFTITAHKKELFKNTSLNIGERHDGCHVDVRVALAPQHASAFTDPQCAARSSLQRTAGGTAWWAPTARARRRC